MPPAPGGDPGTGPSPRPRAASGDRFRRAPRPRPEAPTPRRESGGGRGRARRARTATKAPRNARAGRDARRARCRSIPRLPAPGRCRQARRRHARSTLAVEMDHLGVRIPEPPRDDAAEQDGLARAGRAEDERVAEVAVMQVDVDVLAGARARLQERGRARWQPRRRAGRVAAPDRADRHEVRHRLRAQHRASGIDRRMAGQGGKEGGDRVCALLAKAVVPVIRGRPQHRDRRRQRRAVLALQDEERHVTAVPLLAA